MTQTCTWVDGRLVAEAFPVEEVSDHLERRNAVVWLDVCQPTEADLKKIADELGLHELAVEDALHPHQRPKLDRYEDHLFLATYVPSLDEATGQLETSEISVFITPHAFVTVRKDERLDMTPIRHKWQDERDLGEHGVGWLLHGFLDYVVDMHFETVQRLDDELDALEDQLVDTRPHTREVQRRSYELRKSLVTLRRVVLPMREVVNTVLRRDLGIVDDAIQPYFQDVYDHVLRAIEWTESMRDLVTNILDTHLTIQGNRLNEIMKKLTGWAAIIAVPTAVTGFYGQNVPYPGFARHSGYVTSVLIMVALVVGLYVLFRRKGWL